MRLVALSFTLIAVLGCAGLKIGQVSLGAPASASKFPSSRQTPYATTRAWFGWFGPDAASDAESGAAPQRYIYLWLPNASSELGVRVVSPTLKWAEPGGDDFKDPDFVAHAADTARFDPAVRLERCVDAMNPEDLLQPCEKWALLAENDDSAEGPPNAEGFRTNAVAHAIADQDLEQKAIIRGLYRISVWAAKGTAPHGTFWVQVGADRDLQGIAFARTPRELLVSVQQ